MGVCDWCKKPFNETEIYLTLTLNDVEKPRKRYWYFHNDKCLMAFLENDWQSKRQVKSQNKTRTTQ